MTQKVGRNDSCPCRSGKKYKHCCLEKDSRAEIFPVERSLLSHARLNASQSNRRVLELARQAQASAAQPGISAASRIARALLAADLSVAALNSQPRAAKVASETGFQCLLNRSMSDAKRSEIGHVLEHAMRFFAGEPFALERNTPALPLHFGLEIGRAETLAGPDGSAIDSWQLMSHLAADGPIAVPWFLPATECLPPTESVFCQATVHHDAHLYQVRYKAGDESKTIPIRFLFAGPAGAHPNFKNFEPLFVTYGKGPTELVVSGESGRYFFLGTLAFLEAFSPFLRERGLPEWTPLSAGARRAELLSKLLNDIFFVHLFAVNPSDTDSSERLFLRDKLMAMATDLVDEEGLRLTGGNSARAIVHLFSKNPIFAALIDGMKATTREGRLLQETFQQLWDVNKGHDKYQGFPKSKPMMEALGYKANKAAARRKKTGTNSGNSHKFRTGLWRARRSDVEASTLSEQKLFVTKEKIRSTAYNILKRRGLPESLLLEIVFLKDKSAPEAAFDEQISTLKLEIRILERPWRHVVDTVQWALAQSLAKYYIAEDSRSSERSGAQAEDSFQKAWELACKRLCLRPEFAAHRGVLQDIPEEAWLGRENLADEEKRFLDKVEKLFNLSASANEHEAALAMERAHQLLNSRKKDARKSQGTAASSERSQGSASPFVSLALSLGIKRHDTFFASVAGLLVAHYCVSAIWSFEFDPMIAEESLTLVMIGRKENVLLAEHVFDFLTQQIESQWQRKRKEQKLPGKLRLSFQIGMVRGFREKLDRAKKERNAREQEELSEAALVRLEDAELRARVDELFPKLTTNTKSSARLHNEGLEAGKEEGKRLNIHTPVASAERKTENEARSLGAGK